MISVNSGAVTFVIQHLRSGGAEKQLLLTAGHLAALGIPVNVITLSYAKPSPRMATMVHWAREHGVVFDSFGSIFSEGALGVVSSAYRLLRMRSGVWWTWGLRADLVGKLASLVTPKIRLISSLRSAYRERIHQDARLIRFRHRRVVRYVANSLSNCEMLAEVIPGVMERCRVVYNCLTSDELREPAVNLGPVADKVRIVMVGNLRIYLKGYDLACAAASCWKAKGLSVELHIVGRPDEISMLDALRRRHGVSDMVYYHGEIKDPIAFLRTGHVFLLSSRVEGMPNALIEAMNLGIPCISTCVSDVGRFAESGRELEICPIGDVAALADAVTRVVTNWPRAVAMGAAGRRRCQELFTPERMTQANIEILKEVWQ
jgi:glycosyltransferase involved in cell wall biosynthesis